MSHQNQQLAEITAAILRYLDDHPDAADTVDGITQWWIPEHCRADQRTVRLALARLEAQGAVRQRRLADRHVLYSR